ncbi:MAG: DUF1801 domain-containing protein [Anaerolineales bacterium]|nr:DUF1801 domain-containing protein [Anaerolineales bacterium]
MAAVLLPGRWVVAEQKTKPTEESVDAFLQGVANERRRADSYAVLEMMQEITGKPPVLWGPSMVGFGAFHYRYASGHEGESFIVGFSPRKESLTLYFMGGFEPLAPQLAALGKYKLGKGCLYIKKLEDVDLATLRDMVATAYVALSTAGE